MPFSEACGPPEKRLSRLLGTFLSSHAEDWHKLSVLIHKSKKGGGGGGAGPGAGASFY